MRDEPIRLLYDGQCPICSREVRWLKQRDRRGRLRIEDISAPGFDPARYDLSREEVAGVLHAVLPDGHVVKRLEAVRAAYRAIGRERMVSPLSWPGVSWIADRLYGLFARNRHRLGRLFRRAV